MSSEATEQPASGTTTPESALSGSTSSINDNNNSNNSTPSLATPSTGNAVAATTETTAATTAVTSTPSSPAPIPTSSVSSASSSTTSSSSTTASSISSLSSSAGSTTSSASSNSNENQKEKTAVSSSGSTPTTSSSSEATTGATPTTAATTTAATSHTNVTSTPPSTTVASSVSSSAHNATPSSATSAAPAASAGDATTYSANTPHTIHVLNGSQVSNGYEITAQNGHLAMNGEGIPNGVIMDATALAGPTFVPQGIQHYHRHGIAMAHGPAPSMAAPGVTPVNNRVSPPGVAGVGLYRPVSNHRGHSPHRYSPNTPHSRGNSPHNQSTSAAGPGASPQQQHVVHVVVNPGETFTVCIGDQTQHIPGKSHVNFILNDGFSKRATAKIITTYTHH